MSDTPEDTTTGEPVIDTNPDAGEVIGGTVTTPANAGHYNQVTGEFTVN
jgi:hypothetical protein